ncbi:30S ribosomal protein S5 [Candidatus Dojkabacteria bacterium]|jgi:small subunit ribosomal protein S5|nr:30S ribosomal protein S5 [Candidatus Dojkabacteria bacterium]
MKEKNFKQKNREKRAFEKRTLPVRRVAKVTKGGKKLRFSTVVVVGDRNGKVGVALGRGADVRTSVQQGERLAERAMVKVELVGDTIPHEIVHKYGASKVLLRPARPGTGVIAGSSVRVVLELAGVENVYGKILGSSDPNGNAYCTFEALKLLRKGRVLDKMRVMRDRVTMKEETDKERKIKEEKKRKKEMAEKKKARKAQKEAPKKIKKGKSVKTDKTAKTPEKKEDKVSKEK